ncbi:VirD4-like conjugal transfer protein, CD1115 family [Halalkalibacter lacteus]|uniref:VirD4-like conjugal transfer protein, CD1115 family n=1 Tax=Halalkalibacter lacteus TaxID=3090663 RepID=UPI002FC92EE8
MKQLLKQRKIHVLIALTCSLLFFFIVNMLLNIVMINVKDILSSDSFIEVSEMTFAIETFLFTFNELPAFAYLIIGTLAVTAFGLFYYKLRTNFRELEKPGSKGTSRFTTLDEMKKQYRAVSEKKEMYEGGGGVPISRYQDKIFIDDSPVNNLIIGTTRSGKGEMLIFPMIDIYSRAQKKASMVLNDPKGELFAASKETLEKRGYHVEVLNLDNPLQSMSYQILQIVIDAYEEGNMAKAEQYAKTISSMLYSDPSAKDKFWQDSASALCTALILGLCEKNLPHNKQKITMYTVAQTLNELASEQEMNEVTGNMVTGLDRFFDSLPEGHAAKLQYATVKFASGAGQTVAGIYANTFGKLNIFTLTPIAKMTSMNTFDMKRIGFGKVVSGRTKPLSRVTIQFQNGTSSIRTDQNGLFSISHDEKVEVGDRLQVSVEETTCFLELEVGSIDKKDGVVEYTVLQDKQENDIGITLDRFEHFNKPTALFMITPDYDSSLHVIASLYIKQLYTELARTASNTKGGKCIREVIFILDEFGNMPTIEDMGSIITVCLGRNIRFNLVIQAYSQLELKYDKDWKTLDGNCANTIYILTTSNDTAEEVSKKLGDETISSHSRSGGTLSFKKNKTEGVDGRRLLTPTELMQPKEGDMVVIRGIKRQDQKRKKVKPYPIYNRDKTSMKYRYEYLADDFDTSTSINDIDIPCKHADIPLKNMVYKFHEQQVKEDQMEKVAEEAQEVNKQGENKERTFEEMTVEEVLGNDNILPFVMKKVLPETENSEENILDMTTTEFMVLLTRLSEDNKIKSNTVSTVSDKFNNLRRTYDSEGDIHEKLPV